MFYDYYRKSSTQAGPVAPLTGICKKNQTDSTCLEQDIITHLAKMTRLMPSEKILLGVPFYGYEWQTASDNFLANTYSKTGSLATYQRIQKLFTNEKVSSISAKWSLSTFSPYLSYIEDEKMYQIHFENAQSLAYKMELVKTANLGGVAIWALGYETPHTDIWSPIESLNK
jgi:spore germination protein YaaH